MINSEELVRRRRLGQRVCLEAEIKSLHARDSKALKATIAIGTPLSFFDVAGDFGARREFGEGPLSPKGEKKKKCKRTKAEKKEAGKKAEARRATEAKNVAKKAKRKTKRELKREKAQ